MRRIGNDRLVVHLCGLGGAERLGALLAACYAGGNCSWLSPASTIDITAISGAPHKPGERSRRGQQSSSSPRGPLRCAFGNGDSAMGKPAMGMRDTDLDALCADWPGVARSIKWEVDLVYSVANKMFAVMCTLGPERGRLSFKVEPDRFVELTEQPGMAPAPYTARVFWISVTEPERFAQTELAAFVRRSYELVRANLPKKTQAALGE
jgi:predicted DNA-binding protein (MmcQ/YjbR family)